MREISLTHLSIPAPDIDAAVAKTPPDRDRVIDLLRGLSILVVVTGHALMAVVVWREGAPQLGNALAAYAWLQPATWLLQVLPVFFMVGAAANAYSWVSAQRRGMPYPAWLWRRTQRLLRPVIVYIAVMASAGFLVDRFGDPGTADPLLRLTTQLLWFLGAYLWVTAATPWLVRLRSSGSGAAVAVLFGCVTAVDLARFWLGGPAALGLLNFLFVWMLAGLLGVHLGRAFPARQASLIVLLGLAGNVFLVTRAGYPVSLVGMPGDDVSNMDPPTMVLAVHVFITFGALSLAWPALARMAVHRTVWRGVVAVNLVAMSIYLWHLPVLTLLTLIEHGLNWERPTAWSGRVGPVPAPGFWPWTVPHLVAFTCLLLLTLRITWMAEYAHLPWWDSEAARGLTHPRAAAIFGVVCVGFGISVVSATGLVGFPTRIVNLLGVPFNSGVAVLLIALGAWVLRRAGR